MSLILVFVTFALLKLSLHFLVQARLVGSVTEKFCLNVEDETVVPKVQFWDLVKMRKWDRSKGKKHHDRNCLPVIS